VVCRDCADGGFCGAKVSNGDLKKFHLVRSYGEVGCTDSKCIMSNKTANHALPVSIEGETTEENSVPYNGSVKVSRLGQLALGGGGSLWLRRVEW
jgi:hypothetical protein